MDYMLKSNNRYKSYKQLSKNQVELLNAVDPFVIFSYSTAEKILGWKHSKISNTLTSLKKKKIVIAVKKDNYVIKEKIPENIFAIATSANPPSYISFWTALSYYGYTEQQVKTIQLVSTKQYPIISFDNYRIEITTIQTRHFFGYQRINNINIAEKERLFLDCLNKIESAGGIEEYKKCLKNAWDEINQKKLLSYLIKLNNRSLFSRLGYLLDELRLRNKNEKEFAKHLPIAFIKLHPQNKTKKNFNYKWMVDVND